MGLWEVCDPCTSSPDSQCCPTGSVCVVSNGNDRRAKGSLMQRGRAAAACSLWVCLHVWLLCMCVRLQRMQVGLCTVSLNGSVCICLCVHVHLYMQAGARAACGNCCCQQANCYWHAHSDYWSQKVKCTLCSFLSLEAPSYCLPNFFPLPLLFSIFFSLSYSCFFSLPDDFFLLRPPPSISDDFSRGVTHWAQCHNVR